VNDFFVNLGVYEQIILIIAGTVFSIQVIYYLVVFGKVSRYSFLDTNKKNSKEAISVIICARNEAENITTNLPLVLEQDYPQYEVIVVNDCSYDESQDILEKMQEKYSHLRVTQIKPDEKFSHGKKLALTIGIKAAKNEWLVLTDADCKPESKKWLSTMQQNFSDSAEIVLGYGGYNAEKGFLNQLIRFDTFFIALQYFGFALCKIPYMGVGRNLAYKKSLFLKNKGFASHAQILSGDDDLFINEVANSKNTSVEFSIDAHTRSVPKKTFAQWTEQKKRHFLTSYRYKFLHKFLLGLEIFTRFLFYLSLIFLAIFSLKTLYIAVSLFIIRMTLQLFIFSSALKKLNEKKLLIISLLFDFILPLINLFLYTVKSINSKQHKWK
jgi:cellulose synthase/poly-beta-1,6-N-acetylglucosamine synthase-like glycosyltransferase